MDKVTAGFTPVHTNAQIELTAALAKEIWQECYAHILKPQQIAYMVNNMQSAPALAQQIQREGYEYFLIYLGDTAVGYLGVQQKNDKLLLSKLYLLSTLRGQGLGQDALDFVEALAREKNCQGVWLTVNRHNERAISVYKKTGYEITREEETDIGGGFVMEDFIFEKPL